jgi:hypothetical protein
VVQSLSYQRGKSNKTNQTNRKNNQKTKNQNQNKTRIPSSNAIQFQLVLQLPVLILSLSHQRKRKKEKKRVWRQLCECLSEAMAHLPVSVSQLLLEGLLIADLRSEVYTHLSPQALFI